MIVNGVSIRPFVRGNSYLFDVAILFTCASRRQGNETVSYRLQGISRDCIFLKKNLYIHNDVSGRP